MNTTSATNAKTAACPSCGGEGEMTGLIAGKLHTHPCPKCGGLGVVSRLVIDRIEDGARLRDLRISKRLPLRQCATAIGVSPTTLSMAEQGECRLIDIGVYYAAIERLPSAIDQGATEGLRANDPV